MPQFRLTKKFATDCNIKQLAADVEELFASERIFAKTVDKKMLGHMNDFKRCSEPLSDDLSSIDWEKTAEDMNNMPINAGSRDGSFPQIRFNELPSERCFRKNCGGALATLEEGCGDV